MFHKSKIWWVAHHPTKLVHMLRFNHPPLFFLHGILKIPKWKLVRFFNIFLGGTIFWLGTPQKKPPPVVVEICQPKSAEPSGFQQKKSSGKTMAELSGGFTRNWGSDGFGGETTCAYLHNHGCGVENVLRKWKEMKGNLILATQIFAFRWWWVEEQIL